MVRIPTSCSGARAAAKVVCRCGARQEAGLIPARAFLGEIRKQDCTGLQLMPRSKARPNRSAFDDSQVDNHFGRFSLFHLLIRLVIRNWMSCPGIWEKIWIVWSIADDTKCGAAAAIMDALDFRSNPLLARFVDSDKKVDDSGCSDGNSFCRRHSFPHWGLTAERLPPPPQFGSIFSPTYRSKISSRRKAGHKIH